MDTPWNIFYIIGITLSIIFGSCIPTVKVLIGLNKLKFKLPVLFVFLVNSGLYLSGISLLKTILSLNPLIMILIIILSILFLIFVYLTTKKFNNVAVLTGFLGYLGIYTSLLTLSIKNIVIIPAILFIIAIFLFLFLIGIGLKGDLKNAKVHWVIEVSNIVCQLLVTIGTILITSML